MDFRKKLVTLIIVSTCIRCIVAVFTGLGNDEVYYWTYAQHLQWNYFDHPPLVAVLIRFSTFNFLLQDVFFLRLGAIALAAILARQAPERVLWGTDWPHPNADPMPDDGHLVDAIPHIAEDERTRHLMLVENPAKLFGFG